MKALTCTSYGSAQNLEFTDLPKPKIGEDSVLVRVKAAGLNFPDTLTIQGKDQYGLTLPFIPGREYSGIVEEVGKNVGDIKVGDRVMAEGMTGAIAEYSSAHQDKVFKLPNEMSFEEAAVFQVTYGTAYHALKDRANIKLGDSVAILGASGGVGSAILELSKAWKANTIACVGSPSKKDFCVLAGADQTVNYSEENLKIKLKDLTSGKGVDIICDMIGGAHTNQAFRAISWNGQHLIIGFASGEIPAIPMNLPLLKGASLKGVFWSTFCQKFPEKFRENTIDLLSMYSQGLIKPKIQSTYTFFDAKSAFEDISKRRVMGKICIRID